MDSLESLTDFLTNACWRFFLVEKSTYPTNTIPTNKLKHGTSVIHGSNQQLQNHTIIMNSLESLTDFLTNACWRFSLVEKITYSTNTISKNKLKHGTSPPSLIYSNKQHYRQKSLTDFLTVFLTNGFFRNFFPKKTTQDNNPKREVKPELGKHLKITSNSLIRSTLTKTSNDMFQRNQHTHGYSSDLG